MGKKKQDFIEWLRETSKKEAIPENEIIYGDALYEQQDFWRKNWLKLFRRENACDEQEAEECGDCESC